MGGTGKSRRGKALFAVACATLVPGAACSAPAPNSLRAATSAQATGFYLATKKIDAANDLPSQQAIRANGVSGVALRIGWSTLQPAPDRYDWSLFDQVVKPAIASGRKLSIGVVTGSFSPRWLAQRGVAMRSFTIARRGCTSEQVPEFWDPDYSRAYVAMMRAIRDHLKEIGGYQALTIVKLTGITQSSLELRTPVSNRCSQQVDDEWRSYGYRPSKAVAAWREMADGVAATFPDKLLIQPILQAQGFPKIDEQGNRIGKAQVDAGSRIVDLCVKGYQGRCGVQWNALKLQGRMAQRVLDARAAGATIGWQTNLYEGPSRGSGCQEDRRAADVACTAQTYPQLLARGIELGGSFIEVWEPDILRYPGALPSVAVRWQRPGA